MTVKQAEELRRERDRWEHEARDGKGNWGDLTQIVSDMGGPARDLPHEMLAPDDPGNFRYPVVCRTCQDKASALVERQRREHFRPSPSPEQIRAWERQFARKLLQAIEEAEGE